MTLEELKTKAEAAKAKLEAAKLQKQIEADEKEASELEKASVVEVKTDEVRITRDMKNAAVEENFEKFTRVWADKQAIELSKRLDQADRKDGCRKIYIPKEVEKSFGSKGAEVVSLAKELAAELPRLDGVAHIMGCHISELKSFKRCFGERSKAEVDSAIKALVSTTANAGDEYVPTQFDTQLAERLMDVNGTLANLNVIDVPSVPYRLPIYTGVPTTYYATEGSTIGTSDPVTDAKDLDPKKLGARIVYSGEIEEDSVISILPFAQKVLLESLGNAIEYSILMGDTVTTATTNINLIDGTPTTTAGSASSYLAFDGLVKNALLGTNGKKTDISSDIVGKLATLLSTMGVGGMNLMNDMLIFSNIQLAFKYMANSNFLTWDKSGPNFTLKSGMVGSIFGMPLIPTSGIPLTNSAGKVLAAGAATLGSLCVVKKSGVVVGFRRRPQIKDSDILQASDQRAWVASARLDVKVVQPNQTDRAAVGYGYNATV